MRPLLLVNPKGINLQWLVDTFASGLDVEYLKYLIHYVISGMSNAIQKQEEILNGRMFYTSICSKKAIYKHKLKNHLRFLGECWIENINILFRRAYSEDKCYSYTLSPFCKEKHLEAIELKDSKLANKIRANSSFVVGDVKNSNGKYHYLLKYFDRSKLTIDVDSALKLCDERYDVHKNYNKYLNEHCQIVNLHNGFYRINHKPDTDGRIHTNLTALPKVYRKNIKYKGKQLAEVDLSNSIIFFIAMCLSGRVHQSILNNNSLLYMFSKALKSVDTKEIELFYKWSVTGKFYDCFIPKFLEAISERELSKHYSKYYDDDYNGSYKHKRNIAKRLLLSMLFAENKDKKKTQAIFGTVFPSLLKTIKQFKAKYGYKKLSHLVFQLEAEIMLKVVGKSFNNKHYRKAPLFTLHDCLITTVEFIPELERLMIDGFKNQFGVAPKMDMKPW